LIETNIRLPEGVSASPGAARLWPYQREIADAISDPEIERVTLVKPVRVGFKTLLTGAIASFVANKPSPILILLPTEVDCQRLHGQRRDTPLPSISFHWHRPARRLWLAAQQ
jgi:phage terminase large subunit GpA-like protein